MDPATIRFRLALPYTLFPANPTLAALHAARARSLHSEHIPPDFPACAQCGSLLVQHPHSFRNKKHKRILRRSCPICGAVTDNVLPSVTFPPTRDHAVLPQQPPPTVSSPPFLPNSISPSTSTAAPKPRPKKKSGLQLLLARSHENEEKERQKQKRNSSQLGGLAAFLSDLS